MVGHFVLRAYRSWNADNPNGYVKRGHPGILAPDTHIARSRDGVKAYADLGKLIFTNYAYRNSHNRHVSRK